MNRRELLYLLLFATVALLLGVGVVAGAWYALPRQPDAWVSLSLDDYPPSEMPYLVERDQFWLVHTPTGQLFAFDTVAPEYAAHVSVDECYYEWSVPNGRFIDPCSGDEWELDGRLNLEHSTELWSRRDLDQYAISVEDNLIRVYLDRLIPGAPWNVLYLVPDDLAEVADMVRPEQLAAEQILPLRATTKWEEVSQAASRGLLDMLIVHYKAVDQVDAGALAVLFRDSGLVVAGIGVPGLELADLAGMPGLFMAVWPEDVETGTAYTTPHYFYMFSYQGDENGGGYTATTESLLIDDGVETMLRVFRSRIYL